MTAYADPEAIENHIAEVVPLARRTTPREMGDEDIDFATSFTPPAVNPEIPPHLLDVPGLVGHVTRWITKTALYPQPMLALGAALAMIGTVAGRKYAGPTKSGTHLYVLALAVTGGGKNHSAKQIKRLMRAADMADLLGPGQFMSEPAVYQYLAAQPQMLCVMDEFGSYLQRINAPKGSSGYEKAISGALRSFWGASFDTIQPPAWAQSGSRDKLKPIHSPSLAIYGMSVHDEFYAALQSADIANGFLNRFLILSTQAKPEEVEPELDEDIIPQAIVEWMQFIGRTTYDTRKPGRRADDWTAEARLDWETADARLVYRGFRKDIEGRGENAKLLSRVPEMAVRLATIRAIGRAKPSNLTPPSVSLEDITWGCELATWSAERMINDADAYMVESEHQGRAQEVLRHIKEAPDCRLTHTQLSRKVKNKWEARTLRSILQSLEEADQIDIVRVRGEGSRKPTDHIRWTGK